MGVKAGIEPLAIWEAVRQGAIGRRGAFDSLTDQFLPNKYEPPAFALRLAHKDVSLATALGRELNVPMRLANLALADLAEGLNRGWGERDSRSMMLLPAGARRREDRGRSAAADRGVGEQGEERIGGHRHTTWSAIGTRRDYPRARRVTYGRIAVIQAIMGKPSTA